jgi:hypothetical protein
MRTRAASLDARSRFWIANSHHAHQQSDLRPHHAAVSRNTHPYANFLAVDQVKSPATTPFAKAGSLALSHNLHEALPTQQVAMQYQSSATERRPHFRAAPSFYPRSTSSAYAMIVGQAASAFTALMANLESASSVFFSSVSVSSRSLTTSLCPSLPAHVFSVPYREIS